MKSLRIVPNPQLGRAALLALAALSLGCDHAQQRAKEEHEKKQEAMETQVAPSRRPLEQGEAQVFEFPLDDYWHPAPYVLLAGQRVTISAHELSVNLPPNVIEFRLEKSHQIVSSRSTFTVTSPGRLFFRVLPKKAPGFTGPAQVKILRLE